jgi:anti-sigma regulatory factor (Ser/Thr protein kinase)
MTMDLPVPHPGATATSLTLDDDLASVGAARGVVGAACRAARTVDDLEGDAVLLTSELVTNALLHGRSRPRLDVDAASHLVHVEVGDDSGRLPEQGHPSDADTHGRGLLIVAAVSSRWGVRLGAAGKTVWFEVSHPQPYEAG